MTGHMFRAIWPITDSTASWNTLVTEALEDLPLICARAKARPCGPGHWFVALSHTVPGSQNATPTVLVYEAPARPVVRTIPSVPAKPGRRNGPRQYDERRLA